MPLSAPFVERTLVQNLPAVSSVEQVTTLANLATINFDFDIVGRLTDPNRIPAGVEPTLVSLDAVGPFLDALVFSNAALTLEVFYAVSTGAFRRVTSTGVAAGIATNISGLRITARYCRVQLSNASGGVASYELGVYVRSS